MLNDNLFFSIITVVRNDISGLKSTADSIIAQRCRDFEWIVIDGASTDGCVSFLKKLECKNFQWISEPDKGIYQAMNKGIYRAKGEYIVFLNAGDFFPEDLTLEFVKIKLISSEQPADVLFGGATLLFPSGKSAFRAPKEMTKYIWHGLPSIHQATYYRGKLLQEINYDDSYRISGDYYLISRLYKHGITSTLLYRSLVNFRVGDLSYQNPFQLFFESHKVQKEVLQISLIRRCLSFCKKTISYSVLLLLANNLINGSIIKTISERKRDN